MNPYDDDFEPLVRKPAPLFVPKQVKVKSIGEANPQTTVTGEQKSRPEMTFQTAEVAHPVSNAPFQAPIEESAKLETAKLVGNYPEQLPFADNQDKALELSCQTSQYLKQEENPSELADDAVEQVVFPESFLLQLPALLPQNLSSFHQMENCQIGMLQRHASGKMVLRTQNGVEYCVLPGSEVTYQQKAVLVDVNEHVVEEICDVEKKFVTSLCFE